VLQLRLDTTPHPRSLNASLALVLVCVESSGSTHLPPPLGHPSLGHEGVRLRVEGRVAVQRVHLTPHATTHATAQHKLSGVGE
jgi:hypothetical protein